MIRRNFEKKFNRVGVGPLRVAHIFYIMEFLKLFSLCS